MITRLKSSFFFALVLVFVPANCVDISQCWWSGCQPSTWAKQGCPPDMEENGRLACTDEKDSTKFYCCPKSPPTTTEKPFVYKDCWWSGCQPYNWAVRGCNETAGRFKAKEEICDVGNSSSKFQCCLKAEASDDPVLPVPRSINMATCWWSGCQPIDWAVRGCPKTMVEIDSYSCGNETNPADMYRCCEGVYGETDSDTGESCWWTSCKSKNSEWIGCSKDAVSVDQLECDDGKGDQYQCCLKIPGEIDQDLDSNDLNYYKNYVRYLLLKANGFDVIPENLKCVDLDPTKKYIVSIEGDEDGIRMCDLCPNFPLDKLSNILINRAPLSFTSNTDFGECFGECYDREDCVAYSFDHVEKSCYLFNNTLGEFLQEDGWTSVLINQPTGVIQDWMYSRHTSISGVTLKSLSVDEFFLCLDACVKTDNCNHVSYRFSSKECRLFDGINGNIGVDLEYGSVMAYNLQVISDPNDLQWRFTEDPYADTDDDSFPSNVTTSTSVCPKANENGLDIIYSPKCTAGGLGCDTATGCMTCYYPEITGNYRNDLPICPESSVLNRDILRSKLQSCFVECVKSTTCIAVDFSESTISCDLVTLNSYLQEVARSDKRYYFQYPPLNDANKGNFEKFILIPNHGIYKDDSSKSWFRTLSTENWNECLSNCLKDDACVKASFSYSKKACNLGSASVGIRDNRIAKKDDFQLFLRRPSLDSKFLPYKITPGWFVESSASKFKESFQCSNDDCASRLPDCVNKCSNSFGAWCQHISVQYSPTEITCEYYGWEDEVAVNSNPNSEIYTVKFSLKTINLEALNNLTTFQLQDILTCFEKNDGQSQSSLVTSHDVLGFESSSDNNVRRRRNIFKKIGNAFKKIGKAIVNTVKSIGKEIVDTVKNVGKTIGKVVTGDFKGAKDAFLDIPIVKSGKNAVENVIKLGKSVVKGDWNEAKNAALGFAGSAIDFIPGPGKILKAGGQIIKNAIGKGSRSVAKDVGKKGKNNVGKDVTKKRDTNGPRKNDKQDRPHPDRCRRANLPNRKRPTNDNSCNQPNKKRNKGNCDPLKSKGKTPTNLLDELDCKNVKAGGTCGFECQVGYDEKPITLQCSAAKSGKPNFVPKPSCAKDPCGQGLFPLINVKVPSPLKIAGRRTRISAFVIQLNKDRKLPIWSMAYMDSLNNKKKLNQKRKDSFYKYPCLGKQQPDNKDFPSQGKTKSFKLIHRGHLTPANVMLFTHKAAQASNLYINIAPQDGMTNSVYWQALESQVECYTNRQRSLVVTGICPNSRGITKGGLDIPTCYWKMICYRRPENKKETVVVAFIADNTEVKPTDSKKKEARKEQLSVPKSQSDVQALMAGAAGYVSPWIQAGKMVLVGRNLGSFPLNPLECEAAKSLDQKEADLWENSLRGGKPDKSCLNNRCKRDVPENTRGCTADEAKRLAALLGLGSILMSDLEKNPPSNGDSGSDDDDDEQQGDGGNLVPAAKCNKRMIGYYPSWGKAKFTRKQAQRLTHVVYAFLEMKPDGTVSVGNPDPNNSLNSDEVTATSLARLRQLMNLAKQFAHLKVMFAVGGWENSQYFSSVASSPQSRITFIASVIKNIEEWDFDGVDLDWEYPVTGGAHEGVPADKSNYVQLMKELREALDQLAQEKGRSGNPYLISFAGAAGQWTLDPGFDLPGLLKYANWANVMTYDFFGAWASEWGAYTGPPAPLYFGMPKRYSGKTNVDWTMKYYTCRSQHPHQITMGVPFYGRYWKNVGDPIDPSDGMWRRAKRVNGKFEGGYAGWKEVLSTYLTNPAFKQFYHEKVQAPYLWNANENIFLGYENQKSLKVKANYAAEKNLGGLMIWAIDQDDDDLSMLNTIFDANLCSNTDPKAVQYKCSPITEKRWWTSEDGDDLAGLCGKSAPLFKGYYPVCDPDDPGYSCCGAFGYCGSGDEYCKCPTCVNYADNPEKILDAPTKPSIPVQWYFLNAPDGQRGKCGPKVAKINGEYPICNPDDPNGHCCSNGDFCGTGSSFCECNGCVDFKKDPNHKFKQLE